MAIDHDAGEDRGRDYRKYRVRTDTTPPRSRSLSPGRRPRPERQPSERVLRELEKANTEMDVDKPEVVVMDVDYDDDMAPGWVNHKPVPARKDDKKIGPPSLVRCVEDTRATKKTYAAICTIPTVPIASPSLLKLRGAHHFNRVWDDIEARRRRPQWHTQSARPVTRRWEAWLSCGIDFAGRAAAATGREVPFFKGTHHGNRWLDRVTPRRHMPWPRLRHARGCWSRSRRWVPAEAGKLQSRALDNDAPIQDVVDELESLGLAASVPIGGSDLEFVEEGLEMLQLAASNPISGSDIDLVEEKEQVPCGIDPATDVSVEGCVEYNDRYERQEAQEISSPWKLTSSPDVNDTNCTGQVSGHWKSSQAGSDDDTNHAGQDQGHWKLSNSHDDDTHHPVQANGHWKSSTSRDDDTHHADHPAAISETSEYDESSSEGVTSFLTEFSTILTAYTSPSSSTDEQLPLASPKEHSSTKPELAAADDKDEDEDEDEQDIVWERVECNSGGPRGEKRKRLIADDGTEHQKKWSPGTTLLPEHMRTNLVASFDDDDETEDETEDETLVDTEPDEDESAAAHEADVQSDAPALPGRKKVYYYDLEYAGKMLEHLLYACLPAQITAIKHAKDNGIVKGDAYKSAQKWLDATGLSDLSHEALEKAWIRFATDSDSEDEEEEHEADEIELGAHEMGQVFDEVYERVVRPVLAPRDDLGDLSQSLNSAQQRGLRTRIKTARTSYMARHPGIDAEDDA